MQWIFTLSLYFYSIISSASILKPDALHLFEKQRLVPNFIDRKNSFNEQIIETLNSAREQVNSKKINSTYWKYPMYLGTMYTSQYVLIRQWLEHNSNIKLIPSRMNIDYYKNLILSTQNSIDGSWQLIEDLNDPQGNLNATIIHYAALKSLNVKSENMTKAKNFILSQGGIEKSSLFTKIILALFGNYPWGKLPDVPYFLFENNLFFHFKDFGQWIGPHLFPISYLKKTNTKLDLGERFDLSELNLNSSRDSYFSTDNASKPQNQDVDLISKMLSLKKPYGSYGGYTSATLFTLMAYKHFQLHNSKFKNEIESATIQGLDFVDRLYFDSGESSYLGVTCDGRYWDTALIAQGLIESGENAQNLTKSAQYLFDIQDESTGGFGFGQDFETYMDTDDTAEILIFFHNMGIKNSKTQKAINWLLKMQSKKGLSAGGWGAFDKDNNGNLILKLATRSFLDSADMFDESSPDVTAHILEALSLYGYNKNNSQAVADAVKYLESSVTTLQIAIPNSIPSSNSKNFDEYPVWSGRWGSNYLYGTSASIIGLISAGVKVSESNLLKKSVEWMKTCQNTTDGGFGESFLSYSDPKLACKGISTPSQTAWVLMALIAAGESHSLTAKKAVQYLINNYKQNGKWSDGKTFVGTGHPKIVPMHYPAYAWAFPMIALGRYLTKYSLSNSMD